MTHEMLAYTWAFLVGLMLAMYVMLDGFDLGIGILSLFTRDQRVRAGMTAAIAPIWDANETWLVLAGGALFGAFPPVYAAALNALYLPIMLMLFGLILRAVSFEFRTHSQRARLWEVAFGLGSLVSAVAQGLLLGGIISEIRLDDRGFAGGPWDWLNGLSALTALAVALGYTTIGAAYLLGKTEGAAQAAARRQLVTSAAVMGLSALATTLWLAVQFDRVSRLWVASSHGYFLFGVSGGAIFALAVLLLTTLWPGRRRLPFMASLAVFALVLAGGIGTMRPYLLPPSITVVGGASSSVTLKFMLVGIGPLVPVMLAYNLYLHRVFRGKVDLEIYGK